MSTKSETSLVFIHLSASKFVLLSDLLYRNHLLENLGKTTPQECQNYTSAHVRCSKMSLIKLPKNDYSKTANWPKTEQDSFACFQKQLPKHSEVIKFSIVNCIITYLNYFLLLFIVMCLKHYSEDTGVSESDKGNLLLILSTLYLISLISKSSSCFFKSIKTTNKIKVNVFHQLPGLDFQRIQTLHPSEDCQLIHLPRNAMATMFQVLLQSPVKMDPCLQCLLGLMLVKIKDVFLV